MKLHVILLVCLGLMNCKNKENIPANSEQKTAEPNVEEIKMPAPVMGKLDEAFIKLSDQQKDIPELENQIWHYTYALSLKENPPPKDNIYKGHWLDLQPKGHYKKGLYGETTEIGRFIYNEQSTLLEMRSTSDTSTEWKVKVDPATMLLIGTSKYANNPWQIKLTRRDSLPTQN
jgi:hypothetical protein